MSSAAGVAANARKNAVLGMGIFPELSIAQTEPSGAHHAMRRIRVLQTDAKRRFMREIARPAARAQMEPSGAHGAMRRIRVP